MFSKLLRHEFRAMARIIPALYALCIASVGLLACAFLLDYSWLQVISILMLCIFAVAVYVGTYIVILQRGYRSLYGAEGYLSQTLPVSTPSLILSKALTYFIWMIGSLLVTYGSIAVMIALLYYQFKGDPGFVEMFEEIKMALEMVFGAGGGKNILIALGVFIVAASLIQTCFFVANVLFCMTVVNMHPLEKHSAGIGVLLYFVISWGVSILASAVSGSFLNSFSATLVPETLPMPEVAEFSISGFLLGTSPTLIVQAVACAALIWLTVVFARKKVNVK